MIRKKTLRRLCATPLLAMTLLSPSMTQAKAQEPANEKSATYVLVDKGTPNVSVVLSPGFTPSMKHAAEDLIGHLKEISGADVSIYEQKKAGDFPSGARGVILITDQPKEGEILPGNEEYSITTEAGNPWVIRIFGDGKRGAMYGVYGFLQDELGCRWFTADSSRIPKSETVAVGELKIQGKPAFEYREPYYYEAWNNTDWLVRNRLNGSNMRVDSSLGGKIAYGPGAYVHTFLDLVPPKEYFESHPEYFSLVNGKRLPHAQICLTNPEVQKIAIEKVKQWIQNAPDADIFSVSQEDNEGGACQCDECLKVLAEEGQESGAILRFVNVVAAAIAEEHPNVKIETLAYNYSEAPPKLVHPLPNVRVRLCVPWSDRAHPLDAPSNTRTYDLVDGWSKMTDHLYIWDYDTEYNDLLMIHPTLNYVKTAYKIFQEKGAVGMMALGDYISPGGSLSELKAYLSAQLSWNPSANADELVREFVETVYGKAAPQVTEWLQLIVSPFKDKNVTMGIYDLPNAPYLSKEILKKSDELMAQASQAAAGDEKALNAIEKLQMSIDYTKIAQMKVAPQIVDGQFTFGLSEEDLARVDRWLASMNKFEVKRIQEGTIFNEKTVISRKYAEAPVLTMENEFLRAEIIPALNGKLVQLYDKKKNEELLEQVDSVLRISYGGYEMVANKNNVKTESPNPEQFSTEFQITSADKSKVVLTGTSEQGLEIVKTYQLKDHSLTSEIAVKNPTSEPLEVQLWTRPMLPIKAFQDIDVKFEQENGGKVVLGASDFSLLWSRLNKIYTGAEKPAGHVEVKLPNRKMDIAYDPTSIETFNLWNEGGTPSLVAPEFIGKKDMLEPDQTTAFSQTWTIK